MTNETKTCMECNETKAIIDFEALKSGNTRSYCIVCARAKQKAYREANKEHIAAGHHRRYIENPEPAKTRSKERYNRNRDVINEQSKAHYIENREEIRVRKRQLYQQNRDEVLMQQREYGARPEVKEAKKRYRDENREHLRLLRGAYARDRYRNDPVYRVRSLLRGRIKAALRATRITKTDRSLDLVGCTAREFMLYIESLWHSGMTWANHGTYWQIDHKEPVCAFDLNDVMQRKACFHWSNQQPLLSTDHYQKSAADKRRCQSLK